MDLNEVRILESCFQYLIKKTSFEKELKNTKLIFKMNKVDLVSFNTYEKIDEHLFIEKVLSNDEYDSIKNDSILINDYKLLFEAFEFAKNNQRFINIKSVNTEKQALLIVFKLLQQVNVNSIKESVGVAKSSLFVYNFENYSNKTAFPIYSMGASDDFELVSII
ncbi:hypothetical protein MX041_03325 [Streptococcus uberis]|nr:hypothetical protein [Streptococcus uberis]MCK1242411.1 hypothetical protein [Streptococcus uberis]